MNHKTKRVTVLLGVGVLVLSGIAFGSSAFATDTASPSATPNPAITQMPSSNTVGLGQEDDSDAQATAGVQEDSADPQESDSEVEAIEAGDAQEQASFDDDVNAAVAAGESEDAAELTADASIVTSVSALEVTAMSADDTEAHNLIIGAPQK